MASPLLPLSPFEGTDSGELSAGHPLGASRAGRTLHGWRFGRGQAAVSLIAGCHADEPVGPETLRRLAGFLSECSADHPLLTAYQWFIVPDANPDGARRNAGWAAETVELKDASGRADRGFDLHAYLGGVVREPPGDDVEFGFPRGAEDFGARPENIAIGEFLFQGAPFAVHGTLHGMSFAPGPWFLLEPAWVDRTEAMRERLRGVVREMGYGLLDIDRRGDKGFTRIDEGFSTRPDSRAMAEHFLERDDPDTAALFRPSSMEHVRGLGGDPLTFVSEMPLFLLPGPDEVADPELAFEAGTRARLELHAWLASRAGATTPEALRREAAARGVRPIPIGDQMRLQVELINAALEAVSR